MTVITGAVLGQDLLFTDATYDIGKSGATRPRDGFFSRNVVIGGSATATDAILNQGAGDGEILAFRSSDVAHGMTSITDTSTYAMMAKANASLGGLLVRGLGEDVNALGFYGAASAESSDRSTAAGAAIMIAGELKAGASVGNMSVNVNILAIRNNSTTRFILDTDGDSHQDVGTAWTNFDTHDDVALLNLMAAHVTRQDDPLRGGFRGWLEQSRTELERIRLVAFNEDGHHFVNMSRLQMLTVGAVRQLADRLARIEQRLDLLPEQV